MFDPSKGSDSPTAKRLQKINLRPLVHLDNRYAISADELKNRLDAYDILIVDLRAKEHGAEGYIPGSVHLDYAQLATTNGKAEGLIPSPAEVSKILSAIGLQPWHMVVAYDDETGVEAARLLWTLAAVDHERFAMLNGGFAAWQNTGQPIERACLSPRASRYHVRQYSDARVGKDYVYSAIQRDDVCLVDTRSFAEYSGEEVRAARGGHIPGAVHFNWMDTIDLFGDGGLRAPEQLRTELSAKGITPEKEVIVYCQTNRRSAHTFVVLKWLGFDNVKAYDGSWSDWGNDPQMPVAS